MPTSPQCVSMGVLLGAGRQRIAAVANLFGYYCIGLPSGIGLMFAAGLHVAGMHHSLRSVILDI